jgi:hypothetical protein
MLPPPNSRAAAATFLAGAVKQAHGNKWTAISLVKCTNMIHSALKNFLEPAMFCHLDVLIYKVKDPRYMQNKKDSRIYLQCTGTFH